MSLSDSMSIKVEIELEELIATARCLVRSKMFFQSVLDLLDNPSWDIEPYICENDDYIRSFYNDLLSECRNIHFEVNTLVLEVVKLTGISRILQGCAWLHHLLMIILLIF